jgi:phospholipid/cholesterol/gamma-HCH transport system permease protein
VKMDTATLAVVSVSMCSELGPVLTGLMVAGRVGAAFAAELGTMRVTEQIDALRTLATHPVDYLVVPRLIALHVALPLLTIESIALGIGAGYIVGVFYFGIEPTYLWDNMIKYTADSDMIVGLIKSFIFGGIIAIISCYKGMNCGEGAEGVGRATTEAVVYASITILISNFFLTLALGSIFHTL